MAKVTAVMASARALALFVAARASFYCGLPETTVPLSLYQSFQYIQQVKKLNRSPNRLRLARCDSNPISNGPFDLLNFKLCLVTCVTKW